MKDIYSRRIDPEHSPIPVELVETEVDLYYHIALAMYLEIEKNNREGPATVLILPVGPVYQYRRFVMLCRLRPLDLSGVHFFFMDEYVDEAGKLISEQHPLSFRGFIRRELVCQMPEAMNLRKQQVRFPDPENPADYDRRLQQLGGAAICFAGVGINGHLAFNEPPAAEQEVSAEEFSGLPTRVVDLSPETIVTNSHTALAGAYREIPRRAVTVGMRQILAARQIRVYLNRPWQSAVARRLLFGQVSAGFPASLLRSHAGARLVMLQELADPPRIGLA
jgi:glucosamine-6-phosphate deaminase